MVFAIGLICPDKSGNECQSAVGLVVRFASFYRYYPSSPRVHLMKLSSLLLSTVVFAGTASAADLSAVPSGKYFVDTTHAYINMQYSHLGLSNPILQFDEFKISMDLDNANPTNTQVDVEIVTDSIDTGSDIFHEHITGEKWFDAANNPTISFKSAEIKGNADGTFDLTGDLTIKDMTKPVMLKVTINAAMMHPMAKKPVVGISAVGGLKRSDWGLGANAPFVSDEVKLEIQAEMLQAE